VPLYVINESVLFSGVQPAEIFLDALRRTKTPDQMPAHAGLNDAAQICGPDGCEAPK
jgi:hypothetical protein